MSKYATQTTQRCHKRSRARGFLPSSVEKFPRLLVALQSSYAEIDKTHVQPYQDKLILNSSCLLGPLRNSEPMACRNRCADCQRRTSADFGVCVCVRLPDQRLSRFYLRWRVQRPRQTHRKHWRRAAGALQQTHEYQCGNSRRCGSLVNKNGEMCVCVSVCAHDRWVYTQAQRKQAGGCALAGGWRVLLQQDEP